MDSAILLLKMELSFWQDPVARLKGTPSSPHPPQVCLLQLSKAVSEQFPVTPWG